MLSSAHALIGERTGSRETLLLGRQELDAARTLYREWRPTRSDDAHREYLDQTKAALSGLGPAPD